MKPREENVSFRKARSGYIFMSSFGNFYLIWEAFVFCVCKVLQNGTINTLCTVIFPSQPYTSTGKLKLRNSFMYCGSNQYCTQELLLYNVKLPNSVPALKDYNHLIAVFFSNLIASTLNNILHR